MLLATSMSGLQITLTLPLMMTTLVLIDNHWFQVKPFKRVECEWQLFCVLGLPASGHTNGVIATTWRLVMECCLLRVVKVEKVLYFLLMPKDDWNKHAKRGITKRIIMSTLNIVYTFACSYKGILHIAFRYNSCERASSSNHLYCYIDDNSKYHCVILCTSAKRTSLTASLGKCRAVNINTSAAQSSLGA